MAEQKKDFGTTGDWRIFQALDIGLDTEENKFALEDALAEVALRPESAATDVVMACTPKANKVEATSVLAKLRQTCESVNGGDLESAENMLISQAQALQAVFRKFMIWGMAQEHFPHMEAMLRLAMKAQNQSRATLHTLVDVKYPRQVQFVKQQNIAQNQQIINGEPKEVIGTRVREGFKSVQNKVLELTHERLDIRAPSKAIQGHTEMAAVAEGYGT